MSLTTPNEPTYVQRDKSARKIGDALFELLYRAVRKPVPVPLEPVSGMPNSTSTRR